MSPNISEEQQGKGSQSNDHDHGDTARQRESQLGGLPHYCYGNTRNEEGEDGRAEYRLQPVRRGKCVAVVAYGCCWNQLVEAGIAPL